jgi:outer membrane protein
MLMVVAVVLALLTLWVAVPVSAQQAGPEPLGLRDVVREALEKSREIRQAQYALDEAEERVAEAWGNVYPSVDVSANYVRNVSPAQSFMPAIFLDPNAGPDEFIPVQFGADNIWGTSIDLDQPIFDAASFIGVGAAGRYRLLQDEVRRSSTESVITRVRMGYYQLLLAQEQERLLENSVRRVRESLNDTRALQRAGLVAEYDVLRLEVELATWSPTCGARPTRSPRRGGSWPSSWTATTPRRCAWPGRWRR